MPEEVRAAKRINQEGERIIEKAQEEAERIVARAQEQAAYLIEERGLTEAAEDESRRIIAQAEDEAAQVRQGADDYAAGVLGSLETEVTRTLRGIERGLADAGRAPCRLRAGQRSPSPSTTGTATRPQAATTRTSDEAGGSPDGRRVDDRTRARTRYPVDTHGDPLTFAVSGPDGRRAGHRPRLRGRRASTSTPATASSSPSPCDGTHPADSRTNRGLVVDARLQHRPGRRVRPVPAAAS